MSSALVVPLAGISLLVLTVDRVLGLTAFAVTSDVAPAGLGGLGRGAALLSDGVTVTLLIGALVVMGVFTRPRGQARSVMALTLVALVGLQVGASVVEAVTGLQVPTDLQLARALLLAGSTLAALRVLSALAEHRRRMRALAAATAHAEALARSGREALLAVRMEVSDEVRAVMAETIDALAIGAPTDPEVGLRLRAVAEEVLRPLSHRLAAAPVLGAPVVADDVPPRWRDTLRTVGRSPVLPARSLAGIAAGLAGLRTLITDQQLVQEILPADATLRSASAAGVTLSVDVVGLLATLGELGLVLVLTWWGAARFAEIVEDGRPTLRPASAWFASLVGLAAVSVLTLVGPTLFTWLRDPSPFTIAPVVLLASFVPLLAVTLGVTFVRAVEQNRDLLEWQRDRAEVRARREAARTQAVVAHEQHRLARTLHADVQAAVNAASLMLDRAARADELPSDVIDDASSRIATAVERFLASGSSDRPLLDRLADVRAMWEGVAAVTLDVAREVSVEVDADPLTRDLLVDLLAEACANAVVHGGADRVTVQLGLSAPPHSANGDGGPEVGGSGADEVELTVTDNGTRRAGSEMAAHGASSRRGFGSEVLQASCTRFALDVSERGSVLRAAVPLR